MNTEMEALQSRLERVEQESTKLRRKLRVQAGTALFALVVAVFALPGNRAVIAQGYGVTLASLDTRLKAVEAKNGTQDTALTSLQSQADDDTSRVSVLETKTQYMSADTVTKSTFFQGCNVFIQSGSGKTDDNVPNGGTLTGLGNLTIGYNATGQRGDGDVRTGSHNLIVGENQNYSSYGGFLAGRFNTLTSNYASVSGGTANTAANTYASVCGGASNTASGFAATVSGGAANTANGSYASISGGYHSVASGTEASVTGGQFNTASALFSTVGGGSSLTQSASSGWSAGSFHTP